MTYSVRVITQEVTTRHLTKLGSRALKFDMGPLVAAASLQHVAGIENSAMQLVLMRCSLDLTLNCEPCRLYTTRSWWLLVPQCLPCVIFIPIHVVEMCYGNCYASIALLFVSESENTVYCTVSIKAWLINVGLCRQITNVCDVCVCVLLYCVILYSGWQWALFFYCRVTVYNNLCLVFTFNSAIMKAHINALNHIYENHSLAHVHV